MKRSAWLDHATVKVLDALQKSHQLDRADARREAYLLLSMALELSVVKLRTWPDEELSETEEAHAERLLSRRLKGEPIAYIKGSREFWGLELKVTPDVLIPRPETELLVELGLEHLSGNEPLGLNVLDLGTGSGAIALAIASERPELNVLAVDNSETALEVAKTNAERLQIHNLSFLKSDWLSQVPEGQYGLILSNPPYVAPGDPHLVEGDLVFEPDIALSAEDNGYADLKRIIEDSRKFLSPGWLLMEHGESQADECQHLLKTAGYQQIQSHTDAAGHMRVTEAYYQP